MYRAYLIFLIPRAELALFLGPLFIVCGTGSRGTVKLAPVCSPENPFQINQTIFIYAVGKTQMELKSFLLFK
jgi:hypothetical protein